ncbi:Voltage-gated potassium channel [Phytophthora cactorum]|nr:Voltage-gated potassium channel [Phytophthora cactorum]
MQVKIQGQQIEFTFKGELDGDTGEQESKLAGKVLESSIKSNETNLPFVAQKVSNTSGSTHRESDEAAEVQEEQANAGNLAQVQPQTETGNEAPRKQSNVRFADKAPSDDRENSNNDGPLTDEQTGQSKPGQQNLSDGSFVVPPVKYEGQPREIRTSRPHENVSKRPTITVGTTAAEENNNGKGQQKRNLWVSVFSPDSHAIDTSDRRRKPSNLQTEGTDRSSNLQQQQMKGEEVHTHSDEKDFDDFDESDLRTDTSERAAIQESAEMNKDGEIKRQENPSSHTEGAQSEQRRQRDDSVHDAKKSVQEGNSQDTRHSHSEGLRRRRQENVHDAKGSFQEGVHDRSDEEDVDEGGFQTKSSDRAEIRASASKDDNSKGERQDNRRSQSKGPHREQVRQQKDEFQDSSAIQNSDVHRSDAIGRGRSQDAATRDGEAIVRLSRTSTGTRGAARELKSRSSGRDLSASPPQKGAEYDAQSFSDASEDASDGSSNDRGTDSDDESIVQERDTSSKHMEQSRTERQKSSAHSSSREQSVQRTLAAKTERLRTSRPSRNEREEDPDTELSSDEELSDGPDTPHKRHVDPRRRSSDRHQSRVLGHRQETRPRNDSKRISSRSKSSRRTLTHDKRRNYSPDSSNDSDATDKSNSDDHSQQSSDETPRSSSTHRSRSHHTSRTHRGTSIRYSTPESSRRSRHLTPDMDSLSKRSKPDVQFKRDGKSRSKTRASKSAYKLPEGIVWPPGMEKECIARLGLDGHHPIAPPGLEHLVTEEQWGITGRGCTGTRRGRCENLVIKSYLVEKAQKRSHKRKISVFSELMAKLLFRDLPLLRSPRSIRSMEWKARTNFYLTNPEESHIGWRLHQLLMLVLFIDVGVMASETLDGPRYGSTDSDFPYMLSETSYNAIETLFSLLYIIEFLVRWSTASKQDQFWKSISTWIRLLAAVAALPKLAALVMGADTRQAELIICPPENWPSPPMTLEAVIQSTKRRSDEASQALDGIMSIIKLHSRVCAEAHELVQASLTSTGQENDLDRFMSSGKLIRKDARSTTRMSRAKGKIAAIGSKAMKAITHHDRHTDLNNLRAQIWNIFEYRQDIWQARIVNKMRMVSVVLSIAMFYLQTTPELQKTGLQTLLCLRNVHDYCGRYDEPGCYVFREVPSSGSGISVEVTSQHLDFHCSIGDPDETCYGSGVNFASDKFPLSCTDVFSSSGMEHVCKNRLCNPPVQFLFDMEPYWIYFEFLFGFLFTLEIALHVYSHPVRRHLWGDIRFIVNILVLLPFYVEIVEILIGSGRRLDDWQTPTCPEYSGVHYHGYVAIDLVLARELYDGRLRRFASPNISRKIDRHRWYDLQLVLHCYATYSGWRSVLHLLRASRPRRENEETRINPGKLNTQPVLQSMQPFTNGSISSRSNLPELPNTDPSGIAPIEDPNAVRLMTNSALSTPLPLETKNLPQRNLSQVDQQQEEYQWQVS